MNDMNDMNDIPSARVSLEKFEVRCSEEMPKLPPGQVDITSTPDIVGSLDDEQLNSIIKECKVYRGRHIAPIILYRKFLGKLTASEAKILKFNDLDDLKTYLRNDSPLVYQILYNGIGDTYALRAYTSSGKFFSYKWYDKFYDDICYILTKMKRYIVKHIRYGFHFK